MSNFGDFLVASQFLDKLISCLSGQYLGNLIILNFILVQLVIFTHVSVSSKG